MKNLFSSIRHQQDVWFKALLVLATIGLILFVFPKETKFKYEYQRGKPWMHEDLKAPFGFGIYKTEAELQEERQLAEAEIPPYFVYKSGVAEAQLQRFEEQFETAWKRSAPGKPRQILGIPLGGDSRNQLKKEWLSRSSNALKTIYERGIVSLDDVLDNRPPDFSLMLIRENVSEEGQLDDLFTLQSAYEYLQEEFKPGEREDANWLLELLEQHLEHNLFYDEETSTIALNEALGRILPTKGKVEKGEKVIEEGDIVTEDRFKRLNSLRIEYESQIGGNTNFWLVLAGQAVLISLLISLLVFFLSTFRRDALHEINRLTFILLMVTATVYMGTLSQQFRNVELYVLPFCLLPMMIRTFFDFRLAIFVHFITLTLVGFLAPNSFEFILLQLVAGTISAFSLSNLRKRSQLLVTAIFIFLAYSITYLALAVIQEGEFTGIDWMNLAWFGGSAGLTLMAFPLIYVFEKLFGFLSDVTLMELSDTNTPLLRNLATQAPGTFQHTLQVANLAEAAANEIGADPLLIRTGALYHDIGKMENPVFFIENQAGGINPHDELGYQESAKIIIGHVIRGIEMAKKSNLPEVLIDFIRTHHGTTKTLYFYNALKRERPDLEIDDSEFTYPGPIPYSKETAILMMADSVEAASRSLKTHDAQSIGNLIENIIESQAAQRQFVNADITFKDITRIKKIFKKMLMNIYHVRIEYPE
ncbi:MAG: HD family phosphohydrolase [Salibacteraceae bacterium]